MNSQATRLGTLMRWLSRAGILTALVLLGHQVGDMLAKQISSHLTPSTEPSMHLMIMGTVLVYILFTALPFVPGAEIGFGLMLMFGAPIVPLVYGSTIVSMTLAFLVGRLVPQEAVIGLMKTLHLKRMAEILTAIELLDQPGRLSYFANAAPRSFVPFVIRFRYLGLAILINLPGNAILGGGGGLSMMAGFSRLFSLPAFVLTVAFAILPFPLLFLYGG